MEGGALVKEAGRGMEVGVREAKGWLQGEMYNHVPLVLVGGKRGAVAFFLNLLLFLEKGFEIQKICLLCSYNEVH